MSEFLDQLFLIIIDGGIILGIFIVLLINHGGIRKSRANIYLSVLLVAFTFSIFHIGYAPRIVRHLSVHAYNLGDPTFLLIAPLLWFYTEELTGKRVRFSWESVLHFVPFILVVGCSLSFKSISEDNPFIVFLDNHHRTTITVFWVIVVIQFLCYHVFIQRKWLSYQKLIREEVSNTENVNISWVKFFMAVFLVINLFFLFGLFAVIHMDYMRWIWKAVGVAFSLSVFALGYKGILQKEIPHSNETVISAGQPEALPEKSPVKTDQSRIDRLVVFMEEGKPYLDPDLTLSGLAKGLNMTRNHLSQLVNSGIGENFYDFVNRYRVEEVKRLIRDPRMRRFNLLGIALEAGFKSKSSFNLIFKRFTGLTPSEYRRNAGDGGVGG
ncbi:MAG TPA: helix-turn-helix domain-containing protein [Cyclobacteriaceae bacterium]